VFAGKVKQVSVRPLSMALHGTQPQFSERLIIRQKDMPVRVGQFSKFRLCFHHRKARRLFLFARVFPGVRRETQKAALRRWRGVETRYSFDEAPSWPVHQMVGENGRDNHVYVQQRFSRYRRQCQSPLA